MRERLVEVDESLSLSVDEELELDELELDDELEDDELELDELEDELSLECEGSQFTGSRLANDSVFSAPSPLQRLPWWPWCPWPPSRSP
jgi:hypothetical protein